MGTLAECKFQAFPFLTSVKFYTVFLWSVLLEYQPSAFFCTTIAITHDLYIILRPVGVGGAK